ncbi:MAG: protein kinase [Planctomycetes bacterium]|nr:protein kinase [Planctomycetota bacterium]
MADTNSGQPGRQRKGDRGQPPADQNQTNPTPRGPTPPAADLDKTVAAPGDATLRAHPTKGAPPPTAEATAHAAPGTRAAPPTAADPMIGVEIGGCRIEALLGRGAMGAVYKARQLRLDRVVALKLIRPELLTDPRTLKRFEIEARTIGRFNSPHVVMIHDVGHDRDVHYLVMEFVAGKNLREHTKNLPNSRLPTAEAIGYLRQACAGLEEARRLQVLHRDIKPDNLMLGERGTLKIADFGIAKPFHDDFNITMTAELMGTPLYMSPEQCRAVPDLDFRSDMFSLGATFYYLLTGEPPAKASSIWELIETKTKLQSLSIAKAIPEMAADHPLSRVIEKMTALDREDRYGSYDEILADLADVAEGKPARPGRRSTAEAAEPAPVRSRGALWAVAGTLVLAAGGYLAWRGLPGKGSQGGGGEVARIDRGPFERGLAALRTRFRGGEPVADLQTGLAALPKPDADAVAEIERLREEFGRAAAAGGTLAAIPRPVAALPFTDVQQFFAAIETALTATDDPSPDLLAWLQQARVRTRSEDSLRETAKSALLAAWTQWQQDAATANPAARSELTGRLTTVRNARATLLQLFPATLADLDRQLPVAALAAAEQQMNKPIVDAGPELAAVRAAFRTEGPTPALRLRLDRLRDLPSEQQQQHETLLNVFGAAEQFVNALNPLINLKPIDPKLPFTDLDDYFSRIDDARKQVPQGDDDLVAFAAAACTAARDVDTLAQRAMANLTAEWTALTGQASSASATQVLELQPRLTAVLAGQKTLATLFPQLTEPIAALVPAAASTELQQRLTAATAGVAASSAIDATAAEVRGITTLAGWLAAAKKVRQDLQRHQAAALPATASTALADLQSTADQWDRVTAAIDELAKAVGSGDLAVARTKAETPITPGPGQRELELAATATRACLAAFDDLRTSIDLAHCQRAFEDAKVNWRTLGVPGAPALARIGQWQECLRQLQELSAGMAPIDAGKTRDGEPVAAFFLGATEVSRREFGAFLARLEGETASLETWAARLTALNPRLGNVLPDAGKLQRLVEMRSRLTDTQEPVDNLSWFDAAAFAHSHGKTLPTAAEWQLAAFGPGGTNRYPWGQEWSDQADARNTSNLRLVEVDQGGLSWRRGAVQLRHLAGNVAEWLATDPATGKSNLAGGHFKDSDSDARRAAEGALRPAQLDQFRPGFGLRVALRPAAVFGSLWPK